MLVQSLETKTEKYQAGTFTRLTVHLLGPNWVGTNWVPDLLNLRLKLSVNQKNKSFDVFSENAMALAMFAAAGDALLPAISGFKHNSIWNASFVLELPTAIRITGSDQIQLEVINNTQYPCQIQLLKGMSYQLGQPFIYAKTLEQNVVTSKMPFGDHAHRVVLADMVMDANTIINGATLTSKQYSETFKQSDLLALSYAQTDASFITWDKSVDKVVSQTSTETPVALSCVLHNGEALHDLFITVDKNATSGDSQFCVVGGFIPYADLIESAEQRMQKHAKENYSRVK